jgi:broad specificity phosphatase PhoE
VTGVRLSWWAKTLEQKKEAFRELRVSRVGRRARLLGTVETVAPALPRLPVELPVKGHSGLTEAQFGSLRGKFPGIDIQEMETQFVAWNAANGVTPENYTGALYGFIKQKVRREG